MWVTNNASFDIVLEDPLVQWEQGGTIVSSTSAGWSGKDSRTNLPAKNAVFFPIEDVPKEVTRFRVTYSYSRDGGPLRMAVSRFLRRFRLPQKLAPWMYRNGLIDGRVRREIEGAWIPKKIDPATAESIDRAAGSKEAQRLK